MKCKKCGASNLAYLVIDWWREQLEVRIDCKECQDVRYSLFVEVVEADEGEDL